jgi:hypothetical protein
MIGRRMGEDVIAMSRAALGAAALAAACVLSMLLASSAGAAFGDIFGVAPVNQPGAQTAPAFPGDKVFWAGTCDRYSAPGLGVPISGGVGSRPPTVDVPANDTTQHAHVNVPAPAVAPHCIDWGTEAEYPCSSGTSPCPGTNLWEPGKEPSWRLAPVTRAGAHPDATAVFHFARHQDPTQYQGYVDGAVDDIVARLPAGFLGDPRSVPKCTAEQFAVNHLECPPKTQVGVLTVRIESPPAVGGSLGRTDTELLPVYNLEPREGKLAEFGVAYLSTEKAATARIVAKARTNGDFGVDTFVSQIPAVLPLISQQITLWGVPWAASNDAWRAPAGTERIPQPGYDSGDGVSYDPSWGPVKPLISNPTECSDLQLSTRLLLDSYQDQALLTPEGYPAFPADPTWKSADALADPITGCEKPPFGPGFTLSPDSSVADAPTGLAADLSLPQNDDPPVGVEDDPDDASGAPAYWRSDDGLATSQLEGTVLTLPEGVSVNPSGATGLKGCTDAQMGMVQDGSPPLFNNDDPFDDKPGVECPDGSRIGTVQVDTPLLEEPLDGDIVLGMPRKTDHDGNPATPPRLDPESGQMFRLFIVVRSVERGLVAKIAGSSTVDEATGQIVTTFRNNPRVSFENLHVDVKGGSKGLLAMPQRCKSSTWSSLFTPWTAAHGGGGLPVTDGGTFLTNQRCAFGFAPKVKAGVSSRQAGGTGSFAFRFSREDGEQWLRSASAKLPTGLLGSVRDVPLCTSVQAAAKACPATSRIGFVDGTAGSGDPFVLEKKGSVYLTEGYKGAPYGLLVSVPVEAGPFTGAFALDPIVVRQALHVDPTHASATVVSDPIPSIWFGIPLRGREVTVKVDRAGFIRNPTGCELKQIHGTFTSTEGVTAAASVPFRAVGCENLGFKPRLSMRLTGKRQTKTGGHPGIRAQLTMPAAGQANVKATTVRLPKAFALDTRNAEVCDYEESLKDDLKCPASTIVGRARAVSPLLKGPLAGNVYFAENKRINEFGRQVATLPSLVVALRGEVSLNVRANTDAVPGKALITTFPAVPDAPVSKFNLNIGANGPLQITRTLSGKRIDICKGRQTAEADFDAHNGRVRDLNVRMKTPCPKAKKKPVCKTKKQKRSKKCKQRARKRR